MDLHDRLFWASVAVKRLLEVAGRIFTVCNYFCSCPSVLNKLRATLPARGGLTAFASCGLPVLLVPGRVDSSLPVSSSSMLDPELKVFWDITECTGSNDKNFRPVAENGASNGWLRRCLFHCFWLGFFIRNLFGHLICLLSRPGWSCLLHLLQICGSNYPHTWQSLSTCARC